MPLLTRDNAREGHAVDAGVPRRVRRRAPVRLSPSFGLKWQAGVSSSSSTTTRTPPPRSRPSCCPRHSRSPSTSSRRRRSSTTRARLYAHGHADGVERSSTSRSARVSIASSGRPTSARRIDPAIAPPTQVDGERTFSDVSPQAALAYRATSDPRSTRRSARGFKAGGFNAGAPPGQRGVRRRARRGTSRPGSRRPGRRQGGGQRGGVPHRLGRHAAERAEPSCRRSSTSPTSANANSSGVEVEVNAGPPRRSTSSPRSARPTRRSAPAARRRRRRVRNELPFAPDYTASVGARLSAGSAGTLGVYGRADIGVLRGVPLRRPGPRRAGRRAADLRLRGGSRPEVARGGLGEERVDARYVPLAFAYGGLDAIGVHRRTGCPSVVGITARVGF